ncbi:hypothetical protein DL765_000469 [Monosporascus sp. GIB2]|nr:hypothetical protein DL765_000469 [Monosporascus sp. GIB2]
MVSGPDQGHMLTPELIGICRESARRSGGSADANCHLISLRAPAPSQSSFEELLPAVAAHGLEGQQEQKQHAAAGADDGGDSEGPAPPLGPRAHEAGGDEGARRGAGADGPADEALVLAAAPEAHKRADDDGHERAYAAVAVERAGGVEPGGGAREPGQEPRPP